MIHSHVFPQYSISKNGQNCAICVCVCIAPSHGSLTLARQDLSLAIGLEAGRVHEGRSGSKISCLLQGNYLKIGQFRFFRGEEANLHWEERKECSS